MLVTRILTALVGIPVIFLCVYFGGIPFFALMFLVTFFAVQECLIISKKYSPYILISLIMAAIFFVFVYFDRNAIAEVSIIGAISIAFVLFALEVLRGNPDGSVERISVSFLSAFFLPLTLVHMLYIRDLDNGMKFIFFLFLVVWILDTAAYGFGKKFGKHKLSPNVSPKKSIEGAIAGVIFGILTAILCRFIFMSDFLTVGQAAILGFVISIVGQFSDLAESLIKRDGDIKDSGNIIPGHGGALDRFDSYIFAAPAVFYILKYMGN